MLAALQAPVIMMSQNRQDTKDRLRSELDYDVNRRAETEIQGLARKLNLLGEKLADIEDFLRGSQPAISKIASTSTAAPVAAKRIRARCARDSHPSACRILREKDPTRR